VKTASPEQYRRKIKKFIPSPLQGEGQGGGRIFAQYQATFLPPSQPFPCKGEGVEQLVIGNSPAYE
jgi:hypothetical protein